MTEPGNRPFFLLIKAVLIAFVCQFLLLGVRGYIAYESGVFFVTSLKEKIPPEAKLKLIEYGTSVALRTTAIAKIDSIVLVKLSSDVQGKEIESLVAVRKELSEQLKNTTPPIKLEAFYLGDTMLLWPWIFTCLCWIVFLFSPKSIKKKTYCDNALKIIACSSLLFILYRFPTYARNFIPRTEGQFVFASANYNISPAYFFLQEVIVFCMCLLISIIGFQWKIQYHNTRKRLRKEIRAHKGFERYFFNANCVAHLSNTFVKWQVVSLILGLGFVYYTNVFWQYVIQAHDKRYIISAIIIHFIWGLTWIAISLPMIYEYYCWNLMRSKIMSNLYVNYTSDSSDKLAIVQSIAPIPIWNLAGSSFTAVVTFLLPLMQTLWR